MMELKSCPFCGSEVKVFDNHDDFSASGKAYGIMCPKCSARFGFANGYESKQITIRKFNKRFEDKLANKRNFTKINNLLSECIEECTDKYVKLALMEFQIKLKYMLKQNSENLGG